MKPVFPLPLLAALLGTALALAGYHLLRVSVRVFAALFLAAAGLVLAALLGPRLDALGETGKTAVLVAGVLGMGILGYLLGDVLYYLYMFLLGAGAGVVLLAVGLRVAGAALLPAGVFWAAFVAGGVLGILFERPIGIFGTACVGAAMAASAVERLLPQGARAVAGILYLALLVGGCFAQAALTRKLPPRAATPRDTRAG